MNNKKTNQIYPLLFELIKSHQTEELIIQIDSIRENDPEFDFFLRDKTNNYLLNYSVLYNNIKITDKLLENNYSLDIFDADGYTILHYPIKYNYFDMIKLLLEKNKNSIGVSILELKDLHDFHPLLYCIKYNNYESLNYFISNGANTSYLDNRSNNLIQQIFYYNYHIEQKNKNNLLKKLISDKKININHKNKYGLTVLHYSVYHNNYELTELLLENGADPNSNETEKKSSPIFFAIDKSDIQSVELLLKYKTDVNIQDGHGETVLHYCVYRGVYEIIELVLSKKQVITSDKFKESRNKYMYINPDLENIDGETFIHTLFSNNIIEELIIKYCKLFLPFMNLNKQNNKGKSILFYLTEKNIWKKFYDILINKKFDLYLKDNTNKRPIDNVNVSELNDLIKIISKNVHLTPELKKKCEYDCSELLKKYLAEEKIYYIPEKEKSLILPINNELSIRTDNNINFTSFRGFDVDMLAGCIYLQNKYDFCKFPSGKKFSYNEDVIRYYESHGIRKDTDAIFSNFEIQWINQKIFYPSYLNNFLLNIPKNKKIIIIPLGIFSFNNGHSNYIFYDKDKREVERFEPHGNTILYDFNYNHTLLDKLLEEYFENILYDKHKSPIKYFKPSDYLPTIGLQTLEDYDSKYNKKIGDPTGFCAAWSIMYADIKMSNILLSREELISKIIEYVKKYNISLRNMIRNFSILIVDIRDSILEKNKIDINIWINQLATKEQIDGVITDFFKYLQ